MNIPTFMWAEAISTAIHILNRTINSQTGTKTPYELYYGVKPSIDHYRIFGTTAYVLNKRTRLLRVRMQSLMNNVNHIQVFLKVHQDPFSLIFLLYQVQLPIQFITQMFCLTLNYLLYQVHLRTYCFQFQA